MPGLHSTVARGTPAAEVAIDPGLVAGLLEDQHPDLAGSAPVEVDAGWDNAMFRLGADLAVRMPRRALAAQLIVHEQTWLPALAAQLTLPAPVPLRQGMPGRGYPWRWSVVPWIAGEAADLAEPDAGAAPAFGAFLRALHTPAPEGAPANPYRGVPLAERAAAVEERLARLDAAGHIAAPILATWRAALEAPVDIAPTWLHGDLHPRNVLVAGGAITGIIDWGDIAAGDCATDLAAIWMLFDAPAARSAALAAYGPISDATLSRARGWAVLFAAILLETGLNDHPRHAAIGARTLARLGA
jgi:aminoglycoside phosphotransferase (APT) family kinase protein